MAGMNIARFNTKHSDPAWHNERIRRAKKVAAKLNRPLGILLDLQGPEIRIVLPGEKPFSVTKGESVFFTSDEKLGKPKMAIIPQSVVESLKVGNDVLLDDGACEFSIIDHTGTTIECQALIDCEVGHRKTMNTPGVVLDMPSLTERDYLYIDGVDPELIDFVGLSFVRNAADIAILKKELAKRNIKADIIAKIENQAALDNIEEIIEASEAVMVARGDLGVEVAYQELIYWQQQLIDRCREAGKPVITATQMLKSMVKKSRPTRAEVSDVAHAIYDGTDAVMLSEETTIGDYPVKAVSIQATIAEFNEPKAYERLPMVVAETSDVATAITQAAIDLLSDTSLKIDKIVCLTETGRTARLISRYRPLTPVHAITSSELVKNKLALCYGVQSHVLEFADNDLKAEDTLVEKCKAAGIVNAGEQILLVSGSAWKHPGLTNTLRVVTIE
jgi:pyruvate kinase